jgi:hypothetical protein
MSNEGFELDFDFDLSDIMDNNQTSDETVEIEDIEIEEIGDNDKGLFERTLKESDAKQKSKENIKDESEPELIDLDEEDEDEKGESSSAKETKPNTPKSKGSPSLYQSYASALYEEGVFADIEEEELTKVESIEDIIELTRKQIKANEFKDLTDVQKRALEALRNGVDAKSVVDILNKEVEIDKVSDEDLSNSEIAKSVLRKYMIETNVSEDLIDDLLESYEVDEKLEAKAKQILPKLKEKYKTALKEEEEAYQKNLQETRASIEKRIKESKTIIPELPLTSKEKSDLLTQIITPVGVDEYGNPYDAVMQKRMADPVGFLIKLHYFAKIGMFDEKVDISTLKTKVKTSAVKQLESILEKESFTGGKPRSAQTSNDYWDESEIPDISI